MIGGKTWRIRYAKQFLNGQKVIELIKTQDEFAVFEEASNIVHLNVASPVHNEKCDFSSNDIENLTNDLNVWAALELIPNRKFGGWLLSIYSSLFNVLAVPAFPIWKVIDIKRHHKSFPTRNTISLYWQLYKSETEAEFSDLTPISASILIHVKIEKHHLSIDNLTEQERKEQNQKELFLAQNISQIKNSIQDLHSLYRVFEFERKFRNRQNWELKLYPVEQTNNDHYRYLVVEGASYDWRREEVLYIKISDNIEHKVYLHCIQNTSNDEWYLTSTRKLDTQITVMDPINNTYYHQEQITKEIYNGKKLSPNRFAAISTQFFSDYGSATDNLDLLEKEDYEEIQLLPGENQWEKRQELALKLALSDQFLVAIKGPPGTGKSTIIVGIIRRLIRKGMKVLLVAPTHVALDEVLRRINKMSQDKMEASVHAARVIPQRVIKIDHELERYQCSRIGELVIQDSLNRLNPFIEKTDKNPYGDDIENFQEELNRYLYLSRLFDKRNTEEKKITDIEHKKSQFEDELKRLVIASKTAEKKISYDGFSSLSFTKQDREKLSDEIDKLSQKYESHKKDYETDVKKLESIKSEAESLSTKYEELNSDLSEIQVQYSSNVEDIEFEGGWDEVENLEESLEDDNFQVEQLSGEINGLNEFKETLMREKRQLTIYDYDERKRKQQYLYDKIGDVFSEINDKISTRKTLNSDMWKMQKKLKRLKWMVRQHEQLTKKISAIEKKLNSNRQSYERKKEYFKNKVEKVKKSKESLLFKKTRIEQLASERAILKAVGDLKKAREKMTTLRSVIDSYKIKQKQKEHAISSLNSTITSLKYDDAPEPIERRIRDLQVKLKNRISHKYNSYRKKKIRSKWIGWLQGTEAKECMTKWSNKRVNLVVSTTQGIASNIDFKDTQFDVLICDECSRVTRGEILVPSSRCERVILVGDENQLPPYIEQIDELLVQSFAVMTEANKSFANEPMDSQLHMIAKKTADEWNIGEKETRHFRIDEVLTNIAEFKDEFNLKDFQDLTANNANSLDHWRKISDALTSSSFDHVLSYLPKNKVVRLDVQRRMHDDIASLVRDSVYNGDFRTGANINSQPIATESFPGPVGFYDTQFMTSRKGKGKKFIEDLNNKSFVNKDEARIVANLVREYLDQLNSSESSIMVITFYVAQSKQIHKILENSKSNLKNISILPIDRCQGQEADLVILSLVRSNPNPQPGYGLWLQDHRRLNVALTRAKRKLIIVGNMKMLEKLKGNLAGGEIINSVVSFKNEHKDWCVVSE